MISVRQKYNFMAVWKVQIVEPPAGWDSIADRELHKNPTMADAIFYAIWNAWDAATEAVSSEKSRSSKQ